jgi:hypothetical protein
MISLSRRTLVVGSAAMALSACGASKSSGGATAASTALAGGSKAKPGELVAIRFFKSGVAAANVPYRYTFGLGSADGTLETKGPDSVSFRVLDKAGTNEVVAATTVARHAKDLARPYWPLTTTLPAGTYQVEMTIGTRTLDAAFIDVATPEAISVLSPGAKLPALLTPTVKDGAGVKPICTRQPACPLHDVTLADALKAGKPIAFLIATPAYCQTAICGPVLDVLLKHRTDAITFIHAEVYTDDSLQISTEAVRAFGLDYEPALFLAKADGTIVDRLDVIWDSDDVIAGLAKLA